MQTTSRPDHLWPGDLEEYVRCCATKTKTEVGYRETENSTMQEDWDASTLSIWKMLSSQKPRKTRWKCWKCRWKQLCLVKSGKLSARKLSAGLILGDQSMHASGKPTNLPESVWRELILKIMKITLQERDLIHWVITILCTSSSLCLKHWKYRKRKPQRTKNRNSSRKCHHGNWRKSGVTTLMDICHLNNSEFEP